MPEKNPPGWSGEDRRQWHIDKTVSVSHLITTISMIVSMIWWAATVDKRIAVIEAGQQFQAQRNTQIEQAVKELASVSREEIKAISAKLDRILERGK